MKTKIESKYFPKKLNNNKINKINNHLSIDINLNNKKKLNNKKNIFIKNKK